MKTKNMLQHLRALLSMAAALGLGAALTLAPTPALAASGTGVFNGIVDDFQMTPHPAPAPGKLQCYEILAPYRSLADNITLTLGAKTYAVDFGANDTVLATEPFGNALGSYETLVDCEAGTNPGTGGDNYTNYTTSVAPTTVNTVDLYQSGTGTDVNNPLAPAVAISCDYPSGTFSQLGTTLQAHVSGTCTDGTVTENAHALINVVVDAIVVVPPPDADGTIHSIVNQSGCYTVVGAAHTLPTPPRPGGCDANA